MSGMLQYVQAEAHSLTHVRFGRIVGPAGTNFEMPAVAPAPRALYETRAVLRLAKDRAPVPALIIPLSTRQSTAAELGAYLRRSAQRTLDGENYYPDRPLVFPDPESEALTLGVDARLRFQRDSLPIPESFASLLQSGLEADSSRGRPETGAEWERVRSDFGFAGLASWFERAEAQAGANVFLAPSPLIRASVHSVDRAFDYGWQIADSVETAFEAVGIQLLLHSEVFKDSSDAIAARNAFGRYLRQLYRDPNPRRFPVVAVKVLDPSKSLSSGPEASLRRQNLSEFLLRGAEEVHRANGLWVVQNMGTWALAALDCGADVVGVRGSGRTIDIEIIRGPISTSSQARPAVRPRGIPDTSRSQKARVQPFDPVQLADCKLLDVRRQWTSTGAITVADHVQPEPFWTYDIARQREFRAMQVFGALLELGAEFRAAAKGPIPLRDSVRDRVERMREHDAMFDLCASL